MTTTLYIRTNGNYVSEGTVQIGDQQSQPFKCGPGNNVEAYIGSVPHRDPATRIVIEATERAATEEEIAAAKPKSA